MLIEHEILIDAPRSTVWANTVNIAAWPEWLPTVTYARVDDGASLQEGSVFLLKQPLQPERQWRLTKFEPGRLVQWEAGSGTTWFRATHELQVRSGKVRNALSLEVDGTSIRAFRIILKIVFRHALRVENNALKNRCESVIRD